MVFAGKGGGKGKPDGGEDPPPPPAESPVAYELTWFESSETGYRIYDINGAGLAVGNTTDSSGQPSGTFRTAADGVIHPLDDYWALPAGWSVRYVEQINEANQVCGLLFNDQTSQRMLFIADLSDAASLEPLGLVSQGSSIMRMNDQGDIAWRADGLHLYIRSLQQVFTYPDLGHHFPKGLNDHLQMATVTVRDFDTNGNEVDGSARLTFDATTGVVTVEELGYAIVVSKEAVSFAFDINSAGAVFGSFEDTAPKRRGRTSTAMAGSVQAGTVLWDELDVGLPTGSSQESMVVMAASALGVNEGEQVVGGYEVRGTGTTNDLWLRDPVDGLFNLNDLVVGDSAAVQAFQSSQNLREIEISEVEANSETGYGIISGWVFGSPSRAFILTPKPASAP